MGSIALGSLASDPLVKKIIDWLSHDLVNWKEPMSKVITKHEH